MMNDAQFIIHHSSFRFMKLTTSIWLVFALCLLLVLAAMGWLSATALRADRAEVEARRQAAVEERVRLALWRMDSALAPTVAQESARPYFAYLPYFSAERSFNRMFGARTKGETLVASPLLVETPPRILLHFQLDAAGNLSSPQIPPESNRKMDATLTLDPAVQQARAEQFAGLRKLLTPDKLTDRLPSPKPVELRVIGALAGANEPQRGAGMQNDGKGAYAANSAPKYPPQRAVEEQRDAKPSQPAGSSAGQLPAYADSQQGFSTQQLEQSRQEYKQRAQVVQQNANAMAWNQAADKVANMPPADYRFDASTADLPRSSAKASAAPSPNTDIDGVLMTPLWIDGQLVLARRVLVAGEEYVQGCLLDWPAIRSWLKGEIADLLPGADLMPAGVSEAAEESRLLAALPIRLVPGTVAIDGEKGLSPLALSLLAAWVCLLLTAAAIVGLLAGVMRLSARRASFVTAVTHELRTPLTTFQMYAEMLAENMVPDDARRKEYLTTLRAEAVRLTHLVENVLAYARLERGRLDRRLQTISLGELIGSMQNRLADRAAQAAMQLLREHDDTTDDILVRTNVSAVEQILFNLVDNACKHASSASDKRICLTLREGCGAAEVQVEDHGPGIAPEMRRRLFHSFSKTAKEAAHSAPGVGLGLALSRRLARDLGGELRCLERSSQGACFVLTLPLA
jgi:signal transduction histidine kinase